MLKGFRFERDHSSYFFVYDLYTAISTGNPKFHVGANMENFHDKNGVYYVKELYKAAMAGADLFIISWSLQDGSTRPVQKISYAQKIEGVPNLWIATGVYMDNVQQRTHMITSDVKHDLSQKFDLYVLIIAIFLLVVVVPLYYLFYHKITGNIRALNKGLKDFFAFVNHKNQKAPQVIVLRSKDELGEIAISKRH
ncbi:hypothetical protein NHP200010_03320 [Helicobacter bizzozeronii]|uniref:cache domain-containing protein n=1 Tax=Helicobacter bizzozeronii TaxID=56877 RepID=UPI00244D8714|nr:cache domain-containing protein [Helicobacter bizzozeronii]GMB92621.1 hypothetical protein NHP200010_03320 [Helicobacter bizzozeronii]